MRSDCNINREGWEECQEGTVNYQEGNEEGAECAAIIAKYSEHVCAVHIQYMQLNRSTICCGVHKEHIPQSVTLKVTESPVMCWSIPAGDCLIAEIRSQATVLIVLTLSLDKFKISVWKGFLIIYLIHRKVWSIIRKYLLKLDGC